MNDDTLSIRLHPPASNGSTSSLLCAELGRIADRFDAAERLARHSRSQIEREAAEAARLDALGEHWAASMDLADLLLLLVRKAMQHRPDALRTYLVDLLRPELEPISEALIRLEDSHVPLH